MLKATLACDTGPPSLRRKVPITVGEAGSVKGTGKKQPWRQMLRTQTSFLNDVLPSCTLVLVVVFGLFGLDAYTRKRVG
jgi:hypothetical protein